MAEGLSPFVGVIPQKFRTSIDCILAQWMRAAIQWAGLERQLTLLQRVGNLYLGAVVAVERPEP